MKISARRYLSGIIWLISGFFLVGCATTTRPGAVGVNRQQLLVVGSEVVNEQYASAYSQIKRDAQMSGKLVRSGKEWEMLSRVAKRIIPQTRDFRDDTRSWKWDVVLIDDPTINATCGPGGKITFYTGLLRTLRLNEHEVAAIMGHEVAHAIREHGREKMSQIVLQNMAEVAIQKNTNWSGKSIERAKQLSHFLVSLPYSREMESEADAVGLQLMARAGYDPRAAISMQQKLQRVSGAGIEFLSTHPSGATRIAEIERNIAKVMPLYLERRRQIEELRRKRVNEGTTESRE